MVWSDSIAAGSQTYLIAASTNPRIRVVAGPGTGKSFAMKRRVARLLEGGVNPQQVLPVTFTRVAAEDLHRELVGMGVPGCENLNGVTLHSLSMRILMRNHVLAATGRVARPLNDFELEALLFDLAPIHGGKRQTGKLKQAYEAAWARLQLQQPGFVANPADAAFATDLIAWLRFHRAMLIGEVIPQLHEYLRLNPAAPERTEFHHILVDEYQDLNRVEQGVIEFLSGIAHVCIVGDDDQSIYSFKHARPEGIRDWLTANLGAADLNLQECRRCPTRVAQMANNLIGHNTLRIVPRALVPLPANGPGEVRIIQYQNLALEIDGVATLIANLIAAGTQPGDILVLAQRSVIGTPIYEALVARGVPARSYYAEAELENEEAQRRFSIFKLFVDRQDRVALRWLVGLGANNWNAAGYRRVRERAEATGSSPWDVLASLAAGTLTLPFTGPLTTAFQAVTTELDALEALADLRQVIDQLFPVGDVRFRDLRGLATTILDEMDDEMDRGELLYQLLEAISQPDIPSEIPDVRIMSLHKSKGLSSPVTIIAGCIEGLLPKQPDAGLSPQQALADLEEQRRLFFVGITRVKAAAPEPGTLVLTYSRQMPVATAMKAGITPASRSYTIANLIASRFIHELGPAAPAPIAG